MRKLRIAVRAVATACLLLLPVAVLAQDTGQTTNTSSRDRLFLSFEEDAIVAEDQWWEGRLDYGSGDPADRTAILGVAAFQPWRNVEVGGRIGFGSTNADPPFPDGTGATDFDFWGKYYWRMDDTKTELTAGGVLTVPTGDDAAGLGYDAFSLEGFGAIRRRLKAAVITGKVGLRANTDGSIFGSPDLDGRLSVALGVGAIIPWSDGYSFVAELDWENERFDEAGDRSFVLGGVNLKVSNRGIVRAALAFGLTSQSSDFELTAGYAYTF